MMNSARQAFATVLKGRSLLADEAESVIGEILDDALPDALVAGLLVALKMKGETAAELAGGARAMRKRARQLELGHRVLDTAGFHRRGHRRCGRRYNRRKTWQSRHQRTRWRRRCT
jgi:anthranilate phosphoribosyltransferase